MESKYVYEDPMDLMAEALEILRKAQSTSMFNLLLSEDDKNKRVNKVSSEAIKMITKELPEVL